MNKLKKFALTAIVGLTIAGAAASAANALPCLDGIKKFCDGPPALSWAEYIML